MEFTLHFTGGSLNGVTYPWDDSQDPNDLPPWYFNGIVGAIEAYRLDSVVGFDAFYSYVDPQSVPQGAFEGFRTTMKRRPE